MHGSATYENSDTPADQAAILEELTEAENRRQFKRKPVLWAAALETAAGRYDCIALDLSMGGARLRVAAPVLPQQQVRVTVGRVGTLRAEIVWLRPSMIGVRFTESPDQVARILGQTLPL